MASTKWVPVHIRLPTFWLEPFSSFGSSTVTGVVQQFTYVVHAELASPLHQERALPSTTFADLRPANGDTCRTPVPVVRALDNHTGQVVLVRLERRRDLRQLVRQALLVHDPVVLVADDHHTVVRVQSCALSHIRKRNSAIKSDRNPDYCKRIALAP